MPLPTNNPKYQQILQAINDEYTNRTKAEADLLSLQLTNAERLLSLQIANVKKLDTYREQQNQKVNEQLIKLGFDANAVIAADEREQKLKAINDEYAIRIKQAHGAYKKTLKAEKEARIKALGQVEDELAKKRKELKKKEQKEESQRLVQNVQKELVNIDGVFNFGAIHEALGSFADEIKKTTGQDVGAADETRLLMAAAVSKLAN